MKRFTTLMVFVFVIAVSVVTAQDVKTVKGGTLNGRASSLPAPEYPEGVTAPPTSVVVNVLIDESGSVIFAEAEINSRAVQRNADGTMTPFLPAEPALRIAAENAARLAKFAPTMLSGTAWTPCALYRCAKAFARVL